MNPPTKEQIETVSNLLQACELLGAKFATGTKTTLTMPDGTMYEVKESRDLWHISNEHVVTNQWKIAPPQKLQLHILEAHTRFLRKTLA